MAAIVADFEAKIEALQARLGTLEGKANKKERTQVSKEIYALENDEAYVAATKSVLEGKRSQDAAADDEAHAAKLKAEAEAEAEAEAALAERFQKLAEEKAAKAAAGGDAEEEEDGVSYNSVKLLKAGDEKTIPTRGDKIMVCFAGKFAEGTVYQGTDYSGKQFNTTYDAKKKKDVPFTFALGAGNVIRGWNEVLKTMSLGQKVEVTIGPEWAFRKGGKVDEDTGKILVPPNATLIFTMKLMGVRDKEVTD